MTRTEDPRLLIGRGRYTDDLCYRGWRTLISRSPHAHAYFARAPAHARTRSIDVGAAHQMLGIFAVPTGDDIFEAARRYRAYGGPKWEMRGFQRLLIPLCEACRPSQRPECHHYADDTTRGLTLENLQVLAFP